MSPELLSQLERLVTPRRLAALERALDERTRHVTVVLEDLHSPHNAGACLRTCEAFGVQDVHIVENANGFQESDVACGAARWLTVHRYGDGEDNTAACLSALKERGHRLIAAVPPPGRRQRTAVDQEKQSAAPRAAAVVTLKDLDITARTALLFGSERDGLSPTALGLAEGFVAVPTVGLTESLNLSVAVALCVHHLTGKLRASGVDWRLSDEERSALRTHWLRTSTRKWAGAIERRLPRRTV
ncbi:MAG: TrmH family RNA methyltransferase [Planctomycetaceae bacterium]